MMKKNLLLKHLHKQKERLKLSRSFCFHHYRFYWANSFKLILSVELIYKSGELITEL